MKALVGAFNQEKALVGAFSVIVQQVVEPMEHYTALVSPFFCAFLSVLFDWRNLSPSAVVQMERVQQ